MVNLQKLIKFTHAGAAYHLKHCIEEGDKSNENRAYYANDKKRLTEDFNVMEVGMAYAVGERKLVCDNICFRFDHEVPYDCVDDTNELLELLFQDGYLDLRSLICIFQDIKCYQDAQCLKV